jgi:BASS family bile acid:Na+ symporter
VSPLIAVIKALVWSATFAVMFGAALRLGPESFKRVRDQWALFVRALVAVWLIVPLLTLLVILAFNVRGLGATVLLLMSVCPGVPLVLAQTRSVRGTAGTAFVVLLLTATTEPLLIPVWTRILTMLHPKDLAVQPADVLHVLLPTVFLPVGLGFTFRSIAPRVAPALARISDVLFLVGILIGAAAVLVRGVPLLGAVPAETFAAVMVITVADALIGFWAGRPERGDQKALALAVTLGNPALALGIVEAIYPGYRAGALIAVYLVVRAVSLAPFQWWMKHLSETHPITRGHLPAN